MAVAEKKISFMLKEFPQYEISGEIRKKVRRDVDFFTTEEMDSDPVQKLRIEKSWKQSMGYYLLHTGKFKFGLKDLK